MNMPKLLFYNPFIQRNQTTLPTDHFEIIYTSPGKDTLRQPEKEGASQGNK